LHRIRGLLYVEGYTIAGARRQLEGGVVAPQGTSSPGAAESVRFARREIRAILTLLGGGEKL
jgi:hypothetical protein